MPEIKQITKERLRSIVQKLKVFLGKAKESPKGARLLAMIGRFEKKTDPIRKIEDFGGYYKYAVARAFRTELKPDTITKMRAGWLTDAKAASRSKKSPKSG